MPTIAYYTLGCKVNQYETERYRRDLEVAGFRIVPFNSHADVYVVNTCSVTAAADSKSRAAVRRAIKSNRNALIVVTGCYAELEPAQVKSISAKILTVSNSVKDTLSVLISAQFDSAVGATISEARQVSPNPPPRLRTRAIVKVQDGCDQFCSYCVIPYARPCKSSRSFEDVLSEVQDLSNHDYKEVVLTGIRLGSYGTTQSSESSRLPELISLTSTIGGIKRIRLSSIEPWEVSDALLEAMQSPKVCRHLHIPLQSGDDDTLLAMNRPYTAAQYIQIVDRVRRAISGIAVTTDVIVGFPGETEQAFANTRSLVDAIGFSRLHVFRFSPRKRTSAASLPDHVSADEKKRRAEEISDLGTITQRRFASSLIGQQLEVLVEKGGGTGHLVGFSDNYVETRFHGDLSLRGEIVRVKIEAAEHNFLIGSMEGKDEQDR